MGVRFFYQNSSSEAVRLIFDVFWVFKSQFQGLRTFRTSRDPQERLRPSKDSLETILVSGEITKYKRQTKEKATA